VELIGRVLRLQVQRSRLKPGPAVSRVYNPAPLTEVSELQITPRGVVGDGILDVHHADHADSRNVKLLNGISLMTASRYRALRETYGEHLVDGIAGESLLLDTEHLEDLSGPLALETADGRLEFESMPVPPCVEFSRFVIGRAAGDVGTEVMTALEALGNGARGFYLRTAGAGRVRAGDLLYRGQPAQPAQTPPVRSG
jgi:MOSC domain-containing protein YiiM